LKFLFQLVVDHVPGFSDVVDAVIVLPIEIMFVATAALGSVLAIGKPSVDAPLGVLLGFVVAGGVSAVLWRRVEKALDDGNHRVRAAILFIVNLFLTSFAFVYVTVLLYRGGRS
jgi:chromate transport protein ChrA